MLICFNGVDGSGKSYQAHRLVEQLNAAGYPTVYVWSGGKRIFRRPLIVLGKRLLRKQLRTSQPTPMVNSANSTLSYQTYLKSTSTMLRHSWLRQIWQHISLLEHTIEIWFTLLPPLLRKQIIVSDRYIHDSIIRVAVLAGTDATHLPQRLGSLRWYRVPRPNISFLIDVPAEVALNRKDDIPAIDFLKHRIPLYHAVAEALNFYTIDGTQTPDEVAAAIWHNIQPLLKISASTALQEQ